MSWLQFWIYVVCIGTVCFLGVLFSTWLHARLTKRSLEKFNFKVRREFDLLGKEIESIAPEVQDDFDRFGARLERIKERLERINQRLEPFENLAKQPEFNKDFDAPEKRDWWNTPDDEKPFKTSQN